MVHTLVICAHNDDQIVGAGGTLAKQKESFKTIVFSYGELSHPHLKPEVIIKTREAEGVRGDKLLGSKGTIFLGLPEGNLLEGGVAAKKVSEIIKKEKPKRVFTHSSNDLHRDHRAVHALVRDLVKRKVLRCPVYLFEVWTLFSFRQRRRPKLVVDISQQFKRKMRAFLLHKSQKMAIVSLSWKLYLINRINGLRYGTRFAEVFRQL